MIRYKTRIKGLRFIICSFIFISVWGCASVPQKGNVLALVDGEPITGGDLEYSLQVAHRREDLSTTGALDISGYIQKLIDERLIVQEARRMEMDIDPVVRKKVKAFIIRESVIKLYKDEILDKISVTEDEIINDYKENYERFILNILELASASDADKVMEELRNGESFEKFTDMYPASFHKEDGEGYIFIKKSLREPVKEIISELQPGELSKVIEDGNKYYIIKLINIEEAPDEELAGQKANLEDSIRKKKIKERSDEYLRELYNKTNIEIDRELLASIAPYEESGTRKQVSENNKPLVKINGLVLTAGEFASMLTSNDEKVKEAILNTWLDNKVVDLEALSRQYDVKTNLKHMVQRYENQVLINEFTKKVIIPEIKITEEDMEEYYYNNKETYLKPAQFKIQQITLKTAEEAQDILENLENGANFAWLAKTKSIDSYAEEGGVAGWTTKDPLPGSVSNIIESLKPGDISAILEVDSDYRIIRLMEKVEGEVKDFSQVKSSVQRAMFKEKLKDVFDGYVDKLKQDSQIEINEEAVRLFEERFKKS